jgi:uncharacterized protein (DUF58 family)
MGKDNSKKSAYAVATAAALGYLAVHNMDKVSFKLIKGDTVEDSYGTIVGKRSFFNAISDLENLEFAGDTDIGEAISKAPKLGQNDGLTVIISDFFTDSNWKKAVDYLTYKKRQVLLVQVMSPDEIDPVYSGRVDLIDSEAADLADTKNMKLRITRSLQLAYEEAMKDFVEGIKTFCTSRGADFVTVSTDQPIEKMLFGELLKVGIMA